MKQLFAVVCLTLPGYLFAQTEANESDSAFQTSYLTHKFRFERLIIPTLLLGYGINALHNPTLQQANHGIKEELWTERSHQYLHIDNYMQFAPAIGISALNVCGIKGRHSLKDVAGVYLLSNLIMNPIVYSTKHFTKEVRPGSPAATSFPSGHTAEAFASAELLRLEYRDVSPWYGIGAYSLAAATGYLRLYNNKHWLNDVCAGAALGIVSTDVAYWLYPKISKTFGRDNSKKFSILPNYNNGAISVVWIRNL